MNHEGQNYSTLKVMVYFFLKKKNPPPKNLFPIQTLLSLHAAF